jgi:hypothetical protein
MKLLQILSEIKVTPPTQLPFDPSIAVLDLEGLLSRHYPQAKSSGKVFSYIGHVYDQYNSYSPIKGKFLAVYLESNDNEFYRLNYHPISTNLDTTTLRSREDFQPSPSGFQIYDYDVPSKLIY